VTIDVATLATGLLVIGAAVLVWKVRPLRLVLLGVLTFVGFVLAVMSDAAQGTPEDQR
jgi:hypothetical protein